MKAVFYETFQTRPEMTTLPDPEPTAAGVVIKVEATGICRSDWHGWMGHDPDVTLPHVPGHEFAGVIAATGLDVKQWQVGDRVTVPFVCGCGRCPQCFSGHHQVCDNQFQPGFTGWGSFAEYVAVDYADVNLVRLPDEIDFVTAASLGCRFSTSFRALVAQGQLTAGQWLAVHGCGGVGLSAIMIGRALGASIIAIDIDDEKLHLARELGAKFTLNAEKEKEVVAAVRDLSQGGVHVSIDALGHPTTCYNSIANLRKRGKHIQVGLLGEQTRAEIPLARVIAHELEILGSHGMQAYEFGRLLNMMTAGQVEPQKLIGRKISLEEAIDVLVDMDSFSGTGITVVTAF